MGERQDTGGNFSASLWITVIFQPKTVPTFRSKKTCPEPVEIVQQIGKEELLYDRSVFCVTLLARSENRTHTMRAERRWRLRNTTNWVFSESSATGSSKDLNGDTVVADRL